jgi:hypothetical protein
LSKTEIFNSYSIEQFREELDPDGVFRIALKQNGLTVEILPSQGMAIRSIVHGGNSVLWAPPVDTLPDPENLDLMAPLLIEGQMTRGYNIINTLASGIMMFGLSNWGMPYTEKDTGRLLPLHGEVSNIPVHDIHVSYSPPELIVEGAFEVRSFQGAEEQVWYKRGEPLYSVVKRIIMRENETRLLLIDTIRNISDRELKPSWGYTIKLKPEKGAEYLVPSKKIQNRFGKTVESHHETWIPAKKKEVREERGYIHKGLRISSGVLDGDDGVETIFRYRDGRSILLVLPVCPYFLSWYSSGGKGSKAITFPGDDPHTTESIFKKNWDGAGPEFGSDALDHDGNIDDEIVAKSLMPEESFDIKIIVDMLNKESARKIQNSILRYNNTKMQ